MSNKISIKGIDSEFVSPLGVTVLDAALSAGINVPHSCKQGKCGTCKCKIENGSVAINLDESKALSKSEHENGVILMCKSYANEDLEISINGFTQNGLPIKILPARVESIDKVGSVILLKLKLPASSTFDFYPGQFIDIIHNDQSRSYSISNATLENNIIELHIKYYKGGYFSEYVWNELKVGQFLRFKGPLGNFTLKESKSDILAVCTGTGFAPIKAIIEQMVAEKSSRSIHLIWGNNDVDDFYYTEFFQEWSKSINLTTTLCVSDNNANNANNKEYYTGRVTDFIAENYLNLEASEVYCCGNPMMIESLNYITTTKLKLKNNNFFSDTFISYSA